jgi:SAM-dependent methyltransferase
MTPAEQAGIAIAGRRTLRVEDGIVVPDDAARVVTVAFDGRYVWSFQPGRDARGGVVPWPPALQPRLRGVTRLTLADPATGRVHLDEEVECGDGRDRLELTDAHGHPLAVNKVGNLTRVFGETDDAVRVEILQATARVLADLREHGGVEAFLSYGCLLGAVREGRMIGTDCDADVCYLSDRRSPAEVILESYRLERAMRSRGWSTVRMSGGDFKVLIRLLDGRTVYVDVFVGFTVGETFYLLGNRSGRLPREAVVPTSTIRLEGVELPAPADPEAVLEFVYGPHWRVPDPAFKFTDPPEGVRRLDGWLRGTRDEVPAWNLLFRTRGDDLPVKGSRFAAWVRRRVQEGDTIADLGCGFGRDAAYFARHGHRVLAYDISPDARSHTTRRLRRVRRRGGPESVVRRLVLDELRTVAVTGAEIAVVGERRHLYARRLVDALGDEARRNLWRLARTALHGSDGSLFLELAAEGALPARPEGLTRRLDADRVVAEIEAAGGRVLHRHSHTGRDLFDEPDPWTCRLQVTWRKP